MFKMSAHYANTGTETLSAFVDSNVDNVLFQTNADFTSRFLNSSTSSGRLAVAYQSNLVTPGMFFETQCRSDYELVT